MKRSTDRILTTHVGSLIRPDALVEFMRAKEFGKPFDQAAYEKTLTESVAAVVKQQADAQIADVLLDQTIFAGVGNIIKNEVLSLQHIAPQRAVATLSTAKLKALIAETQAFSRQFYRWRKIFMLKKNLRAHRRALCPHCGGKLTRAKTGVRDRWSYWCPVCQA